jgi:hypothetical protein
MYVLLYQENKEKETNNIISAIIDTFDIQIPEIDKSQSL